MAAGVAAAVLLIVVVFHPWDMMMQDDVPRPKSLPGKAAFAAFFQGFQGPSPPRTN